MLRTAYTKMEKERHKAIGFDTVICEDGGRRGYWTGGIFHSRNINYLLFELNNFSVELNSIKKILIAYPNNISIRINTIAQKRIFLQLLCGTKMKRNKYMRWNEKKKLFKIHKRQALYCNVCGGWLDGWIGSPFFYFVEKFAFFVKVNKRTCLLIFH